MSLTVTRNYRATIIFDTRGYDEPVETLIEKITTILTSAGADVQKVNNVGYKDFVVGATKRHAGDIFVTYDFASGPDVPEVLREKTRLDKTVMRLQVNRR